jgi:hypothetical protein
MRLRLLMALIKNRECTDHHPLPLAVPDLLHLVSLDR